MQEAMRSVALWRNYRCGHFAQMRHQVGARLQAGDGVQRCAGLGEGIEVGPCGVDPVPGPVQGAPAVGGLLPGQEGFDLGVVGLVVLRIDLPHEGTARPQGPHQRVLAPHEVQIAGPQQVVVVGLCEVGQVGQDVDLFQLG